MANLCAGICSSLLIEKGAGYRGFARHRLRSTPRAGWPASRAIGGSFAVELAAAFAWNRWQACYGISGSFAVESVAGFAWNRWQLWRGIRISQNDQRKALILHTERLLVANTLFDHLSR